MKLFRKSCSLKDCGFFIGFTDWHSHLLPGVDDGVQTMEESLQILSDYEALGVSEIWLTPHIMEDIPNTTSYLRKRFAELNSLYKGKVRLRLGAENMLDNLFEERLAKNDLLPIGERGDHLLVETSYFNPPMDLYGMLAMIMKKGFYPVLAHPERYGYMTEKNYYELKTMGVKLQMNIFSLMGAYGVIVQHKCRMLLAAKMYDFVGTDIHNIEMFMRFTTIPKNHASEYKKIVILNSKNK